MVSPEQQYIVDNLAEFCDRVLDMIDMRDGLQRHRPMFLRYLADDRSLGELSFSPSERPHADHLAQQAKKSLVTPALGETMRPARGSNEVDQAFAESMMPVSLEPETLGPRSSRSLSQSNAAFERAKITPVPLSDLAKQIHVAPVETTHPAPALPLTHRLSQFAHPVSVGPIQRHCVLPMDTIAERLASAHGVSCGLGNAMSALDALLLPSETRNQHFELAFNTVYEKHIMAPRGDTSVKNPRPIAAKQAATDAMFKLLGAVVTIHGVGNSHNQPPPPKPHL